MQVVVGSKALEYFNLNRNTPSDYDLWATEKQKGIDVTIMPEEIIEQVPTQNGFATPDAVYTIKCSHLGWNIHWQKTKLDILWLKSKGCKLIPDLYRILVNHWKQVNGNKDFLSLNKTKQEFFDDNVKYVFDHDYLHELVAYPHRPIYEQCLKDGQDVLIDKNKFDKMSFENKVKMFREEISVIAAERWLINPYWRGRVSWYEAYVLSLEKTITNLIKNWAQDFVVLNLEYFVKPDYSYFKHLLIETGIGDKIMSNVDISVFEDTAEKAGYENNLSEMIYEMCEGDFDIRVDLPFPERGDRSWGDESYQEELNQYHEDVRQAKLKKSEEVDIEYEHLEQEGGGEGGSEYCYGVFKLNGKIYRAEYSYYSYHGHDYDYIQDTLREVKPVEKTITVYE